MDATTAMWISILACAAALVVVAATGVRAHRAWMRTRHTQQAAIALMDIHRARIDEGVRIAGERAGKLADEGEHLADLLAQLRSDAEQLTWLVKRIPEARADLRRELHDLFLPTREDDRERTGV